MTRRVDTSLRKAISVLEGLLLTEPSPEIILSRALGQIVDLLEAKFGFVYECHASDDDRIPWELVMTCEAQSDAGITEVENSATSSSIPSDIIDRLLTGQCIVNDGLSKIAAALPHFHPVIEDWLAIPIIDANSIHGVIFVCNANASAYDGIEGRLRPFVAATNCLLRAAEKKRHFQSNDLHNHPKLDLLPGLLDTMFNGVIVVNQDDCITLCNDAASSLLSLPKREIIGNNVDKFLPQGSLQLENRLSSSQKDDVDLMRKPVWRGVPVIKPNGERVLVDLSGFELRSGDEVLRGLVIDDISERIRSSSDYHETLQRFQALTNLVPVAILQLNRDWECTYANDTWCEYCQMTPDEAQGTGWLKGLHLDDVEATLVDLRRDTSMHGKYEGEFRLLSPLGKITWVKTNACVLFSESGEIGGLILTLNDITDEKSNAQRLQEIAEKDQLTGLVNRAFFNDRVELAIRGIQRNGAFALMFIDLDEFKHINDTLGHAAGDKLLKDVASRLSDTIRSNDTIARIGGDEFTVILNAVHDASGVMAIADKLIDAMKVPFLLNSRSIYVTCSVGITIAERADTNTTELLKQADSALYKAKGAGKNQYKFYTEELDYEARLHIYLRQSLMEKAQGAFRVVYQPQVDASTKKLVGIEALARWQHPEIEPIGPDIFIKTIEDSGLISVFSDWLFDEVFKTVDYWQKLGLPVSQLKIGINLSAKQFKDHDLAANIHSRCASYGINPKLIVLELTETAILEDPAIAADTLSKLSRYGFDISLDDFGTGYSSLMHLRKLPLKTIKIDRSFIKDVLYDDGDAKIVQAMIALANTLDIGLVAEGVDNSDIKHWLLEHGCECQQGYLYYKPLEKQQIEALLTADFDSNVVSISPKV